MEIKNPIYADFNFEQIYHIYTRVSGNEFIYKNEANYQFFLQKISKYILPYAEIYAYCLVPQRFSLMICFHSSKIIFKNLDVEEKDMNLQETHKFLMKPISNLLNSYAKAYNKMYHRKGALFVDFIKREILDNEEDLKQTLKYIHQIPLQNRIVNQFEDWKYSSYRSYLEPEKPSKIGKTFMMSFFDHSHQFIEFHKK